MRVEERADSEPGRGPETAEQIDDIASTSTGSTVFSLDLSACTKPYQPPPQCIEKQILSTKSLTFQEKWYQDFPWLHYSPSVKGVLCFYCSKGVSNQSSLGHRPDAAFVSTGFRNWKKAIEKFTAHQTSQAHQHYVTARQPNPISAQLSSAWRKQQEVARHCLRKIVSTVWHVARQGQSLRGHTEESGNLYQLIKLRAEEDDPVLLKC